MIYNKEVEKNLKFMRDLEIVKGCDDKIVLGLLITNPIYNSILQNAFDNDIKSLLEVNEAGDLKRVSEILDHMRLIVKLQIRSMDTKQKIIAG